MSWVCSSERTSVILPISFPFSTFPHWNANDRLILNIAYPIRFSDWEVFWGKRCIFYIFQLELLTELTWQVENISVHNFDLGLFEPIFRHCVFLIPFDLLLLATAVSASLFVCLIVFCLFLFFESIFRYFVFLIPFDLLLLATVVRASLFVCLFVCF